MSVYRITDYELVRAEHQRKQRMGYIGKFAVLIFVLLLLAWVYQGLCF